MAGEINSDEWIHSWVLSKIGKAVNALISEPKIIVPSRFE